MTILARLGVGVAAFVATNLDDILLLSAFFADGRVRPRAVVAGQYLGIGALTAASAAAAAASLAVPPGWTALLGVVPLALGVRALFDDVEDEAAEAGERLRGAQRRTRSQALAVAGVTVANGGDNVGVYVPLFASDLRAVALHAAVFAAMTALWCWMGYRLVNNRWVGDRVRRFAGAALPAVLVGLGLYILWGARVLLR